MWMIEAEWRERKAALKELPREVHVNEREKGLSASSATV